MRGRLRLRRRAGISDRPNALRTQATTPASLQARVAGTPLGRRRSSRLASISEANTMSHEIPAGQQMFKMITGYWVSQAIGTFAELGMADELAKGPSTAARLARGASTDESATFRLLRALAAVGVLQHGAGDEFALSALGQTLRSDTPGSMRDMARAQTAPGHWLPWGRLRDAV